MYSGYGFRNFEIGDVDVVKHQGLYHLFHLTLPNHAYIAHAVSSDGLQWQRVKNALFISDPKAWDDDMLWTMHVSPDPYRPGEWRMFYTGLSMAESGRVQRVGVARSKDLYHWQKDTSGAYPLEIADEHYESSLDEGRQWVSFRDPFCFQENDNVYLLAAARTNTGPVIRRGCVGLAQEVAENKFDFLPPLFQPMHYDDVEVPNLFKMDGKYYLLGSIREDIKVHYWWANDFEGPYKNFADNVLLPQGNYAARVAWDEDKLLVWNFFFKGLTTKGDHLMAPPKELAVDSHQELRLKSFSGFDDIVRYTLPTGWLTPLRPLFGNPYATGSLEAKTCRISCASGFAAFLLQGQYNDFILSGLMDLQSQGKCGLVLRLNEQGDGYYISLDFFKGLAQIRAWRHRPDGIVEEAFQYNQLQAAHYITTAGPHQFKLIAYQQYLEFSLDGFILLTLADDRFEQGHVGFYVENATVQIDDLQLKICDEPPGESYPTDLPNY